MMADGNNGVAIFIVVLITLGLGFRIYMNRSRKNLEKEYTFDKVIEHDSGKGIKSDLTFAFIDGKKRKIGFMMTREKNPTHAKMGLKTLVEDIEKLESITVRSYRFSDLVFSIEGKDKIYIGSYEHRADAIREANEFKKFLEKLGHSIDIY